jgi:hypothetical protein
MLHKALAKWLPGHNNAAKGQLRDPAGNSLIHTLRRIRADEDSDGNPGTLRTTFAATALIYGGLLPSKTGCVAGDVDTYMVSNRWRGNALTMQAVDATYVKGDWVNGSGTGQPLDRLRVQDVSGASTFYERIVLSDGTIIKLTGDDGVNGLEGGSPKYEVYGGLTAENEASFLYESTAFWHWNDKDAGEPDICWSDSAEYRTAFQEHTDRVAVGFFLDKLALETDFETFEELVAFLEDPTNLACSTGSCQDEYERYEALYEEGMLVYQVPDDGSELPGDEEGVVEYQNGSLTGDVVIIEGGIAEGGLTSGPNFESGRRTWIDILPD